MSLVVDDWLIEQVNGFMAIILNDWEVGEWLRSPGPPLVVQFMNLCQFVNPPPLFSLLLPLYLPLSTAIIIIYSPHSACI